jgi:hydroxymethylbilane synthase
LNRTIIIGTRGSALALWQANYTKQLLENVGQTVDIKIITTQGDRTQQWDTAFDKLEGKGFFTKELEDELLAKTIDLAVHSHKDLPTINPPGLLIAGVSKREDPSDVLLIRKENVDESQKFSLKKGAKVGTSSTRRKNQLVAFRNDLELLDLRGNVPTRIEKLRAGNYDAILIASAGIERLELDLEDLHVEKLNPEIFVPAPAQGVLAWQTREDDDGLLNIIDKINEFDVLVKINIERTILNLFEGGCHMPLGAFCDTEETDDDRLKFKVWVSMSPQWEQQPKQLYFETFNTDGFADEIVDKIKGVQPKKIFITKNLKENDYFFSALNKLGFEVEGKSLIDFKEIKIKELPKADWIFFSSKHSVRYFLGQKPKLENVKFGCVGGSTSAELRTFGFRADFIGQGTDTKLIGKQFAAKVGNGKALFPIAKDSMKTFQWQMPKQDNVINLNVYWTIKHTVEVSEEKEILIFTSPSNLQAYLEKNKIHKHQTIIAMGDATGKELEKNKIKKYAKPISFDDLGLVQAVLGIS